MPALMQSETPTTDQADGAVLRTDTIASLTKTIEQILVLAESDARFADGIVLLREEARDIRIALGGIRALDAQRELGL